MDCKVSDEAERGLLVKLKTECGYQFTSKLESMFTDIKTSRDTMQDYKAHRRPLDAASSTAAPDDNPDVDLSVQARPSVSLACPTTTCCLTPPLCSHAHICTSRRPWLLATCHDASF